MIQSFTHGRNSLWKEKLESFPPPSCARRLLKRERVPRSRREVAYIRPCVLSEFTPLCAFVRVEVRHPCALLSAHRGRVQTPSSRGNVCAIWIEKRVRVSVLLPPSPLFIPDSHFNANLRKGALSPWL